MHCDFLGISMLKNKDKKKLIPILFVVLFIVLIIIPFKPSESDVPIVMHQITDQQGLSLIWQKESAFGEDLTVDPVIKAKDGRLYFMGAFNSKANFQISASDIQTGDFLFNFKIGKPRPYGFVVSGDGLFTAISGSAELRKYSLENGIELWKTPLKTHALRSIYLLDNEVQTYFTPDVLIRVDANTGKILDRIEPLNGQLYLEENGIAYFAPFLNTIAAMNQESIMILWQAKLEDFIYWPPLFDRDNIFVKDGEYLGKIYKIDKNTGELVWKSNYGYVSNLAVSPSYIYGININGELCGLNRQTGEVEKLIKFSNQPFELNGQHLLGGYAVAYDEKTHIVVVLLGDSGQMFAFIEKEENK
jgi:outer membrane protein assembly factor BamB